MNSPPMNEYRFSYYLQKYIDFCRKEPTHHKCLSSMFLTLIENEKKISGNDIVIQIQSFQEFLEKAINKKKGYSEALWHYIHTLFMVATILKSVQRFLETIFDIIKLE